MPGKVIPCALCQAEAAAVFCVNDDAHLCAGCDASVHAGNPLLARHERRPLTAITAAAGECASVAHGASSPACTDCDVAVVPQLGAELQSAPMPAFAAQAPRAPAQPAPTSFSQQLEQLPAVAAVPTFDAPASPAAGLLSLYEDSFFARSLTTSDLLDLDADDLELPGACSAPGLAYFDPLDDCVVPSFGGVPEPAPRPYMHQGSFMQQPGAYAPAAYHPYQKPAVQQPGQLVPMGGLPAAPKPHHMSAAAAAQQHMTDAEAEAERVRRHRERQRKKRAFGRAVRYQSRRAYAEIRPRIKGRFVTPEEYAAYQAQQAAAEKVAAGEAPAAYVPAQPLPFEEEADAVVPMPTFVA